MEMSNTRRHSFKVRREKFKRDVRGMFLHCGGCLECSVGVAGGIRYESNT